MRFPRVATKSLSLALILAGIALSQGSFGWNPVPAAADALAKETGQLYGREVDFLVAQSDDRDALLYRWLARALGVDRYVCVHQGNAGTCVGAGTCQAISTVSAIEILLHKESERWVAPYSIEAVYAIGRQCAGQLGAWDGSTGAWSCRGISELGTCVQQPYGSHDLTKYDPARAQRWARMGVPREILEAAKPHRVRAVWRVESPEQARAFNQNGNTIITCSNESYVNTRDSAGFARNDGRNAWPHCMCILGYRGQSSGRVGWLVVNSWGGKWISGPVWPADQPEGSFWITESDLREHLRAGDTWAIGDVAGFPEKLLKLRDALNVGGPVFGGVEDGRSKSQIVIPDVLLRAAVDRLDAAGRVPGTMRERFLHDAGWGRAIAIAP